MKIINFMHAKFTMRSILKFNTLFILLMMMCFTTYAQTPFDSFDTLQKLKPILTLPNTSFRVENLDSSNKVRYIELNNETLLLKYLSKENELLSEVQLRPNDFKWQSTDPLASKYPSHSPYNFVTNNPINAIDPDGRDVELIIGKPYTDANGEEHPYGHMALRVYNKELGYDMVFDFGRYGEVSGFMGTEGDGILNVYLQGQNYVTSEQKIRESVGYSMVTTHSQDEKIINYFNGLIKEGDVYKTGAVPNGGGTAYKLEDDYNVFNNNCVTKTANGLEIINKNIIGNENDPRDAYKIMENSYKQNSMTRTEYKKGGTTTTTYDPKHHDTNGNPQPVLVSPGVYITPE